MTRLDFFTFSERAAKGGAIEIRPDWKVLRSYDLMVRGRDFYAVWDEERGLWSTDEYDVQRLVDRALDEYRRTRGDGDFRVKYLRDFSSGMWTQCQTYIRSLSDNSHDLDTQLTFANTPVRKEQYASRRLPYALEAGDISAYEELISTPAFCVASPKYPVILSGCKYPHFASIF